MINIIAHRGWWRDPKEKNSLESFRSALKNGFGIETDLRDYNGELVISHDIPTSNSPTFESFISIVNEYDQSTLALNIKSDGLSKLVKRSLTQNTDYFVFDMSVPDTLSYIREDIKFFTRFSDIEPYPALIGKSSGVWLDCFGGNRLDIKAMDGFIKSNKKICLVSPELHGFEHENYWDELLSYLNTIPNKKWDIGLCTDLPQDAKEFFNEH